MIDETLNLRDARAKFEREYLLHHLERLDDNMTHVAKFIGMNRAALARKLKDLGIVRRPLHCGRFYYPKGNDK